MKQRCIHKIPNRIPNRLVRFGFAAGLLFSTATATAAGQIAMVSNDTTIEPGEEFSATVMLNGEGQYDVYFGVTGGVLGETIHALDANGALIPWKPEAGPPAKLRDNVDLASLSVEQKNIAVFSGIRLDGLTGSYTLYAALSTPGQLDFPVIDVLKVEVKSSVSTHFSLSGRIRVTSNTAKDNDVNDVNAPELSNNTDYIAQRIPNPVILGGYVNKPGTGPSGRFEQLGDTDDYFDVDLRQGQTILLFITNPNLVDNDLDLGLFRLNNEGIASLIDASTGDRETEMLTVPDDGRYFVLVQAHSGASNYVLSIGQNTTTTALGTRLTDDFVPGEAVVRFKPESVQQARSAITRNTQTQNDGTRRSTLLTLDSTRSRTSSTGGLSDMKFDSPELRHNYETLMAIKKLRKDPSVSEAGPNYYMRALRVPNDELYHYQWNLTQINLPQAWDMTTGDPSVIVAVADTGVLLEHPDLRDNLVPGYDFIDNSGFSLDGDGYDSNPNDPGDQLPGGSSFHGTHVAGTVAAITNNDEGVAGVAWLTKIMPLRVLGKGGAGSNYSIEQALRYAAGLPNDSGTVPAQRADIVNLSLGGPAVYPGFQQLITDIRNAGVIIVAAAGNEDTNLPSYPAALDGVVSVSAVDINSERASYSNYGPTIDVAAPGGDGTPDVNGDGMPDSILSTIGNDVGFGSGIALTFDGSIGTSMATPHIAGVISLMKAVNPDLTPQAFDDLLKSGQITNDLGSTGRDDYFGYGLIDAQKAVSAAMELGGVAVPEQQPQLVVNPASLNFGLSRTSTTLTFSNGGDGDLQIVNISDDAGGFLSWEGNGLGNYTVRVDRSGLNIGTFTATITITSNVNTVKIPVILQVGDPNATGDAGLHYIVLVEPNTLETIDQTQATVTNGVYEFSFHNVPKGEYIIAAGNDFDNDGFICDVGEACGAYSTVDRPTPINVTDNRSDINFSTGFNVNFVTTKAVEGVETTRPFRGFARLDKKHK